MAAVWSGQRREEKEGFKMTCSKTRTDSCVPGTGAEEGHFKGLEQSLVTVIGFPTYFPLSFYLDYSSLLRHSYPLGILFIYFVMLPLQCSLYMCLLTQTLLLFKQIQICKKVKSTFKFRSLNASRSHPIIPAPC